MVFILMAKIVFNAAILVKNVLKMQQIAPNVYQVFFKVQFVLINVIKDLMKKIIYALTAHKGVRYVI
jgi:hypothetical protein